mgnify:FL=1
MDTIRGRPDTHIEGESVMGTFTMATGFGMLVTGLIVLAIISTGFLLITRKIERDRKEEIEKKEREKIYGSN